MAVKFIIDSASDVLPNECKKLGAVHVPLTVRFGEKEFADAVDLSHKKFYKMLTSGTEEHPTTSQVTPAAWAEAMEEATRDGDTAVVITLSPSSPAPTSPPASPPRISRARSLWWTP